MRTAITMTIIKVIMIVIADVRSTTFRMKIKVMKLRIVMIGSTSWTRSSFLISPSFSSLLFSLFLFSLSIYLSINREIDDQITK